MSYSKNLAQIDPQSFGNWILVDEREISSAVVNYTISGIDGDVDPKWMFELNLKGPSNLTNGLYIRPNNDSTSTYLNPRQYGGASTGGDNIYANTKGLVLGHGSSEVHDQTSSLVFNSKVTGTARQGYTNCTYKGASGAYDFKLAPQWPNTTDKITSFTIHSDGVTVTKAIIRVYKWTDLKPVTLHSYELVKEYNLSAQTLNDTITIDGDIDDRLIVEHYINVASPSTDYAEGLYAQINGDTGANYRSGYLNQATSSASAGYTNTGTNLLLSYSGQYGACAISHMFLKSGFYKSAISQMGLARQQGYYYYSSVCQSFWTNTAAKVTSIRFFTNVNVTGWVRVYKLAKSHLICQEPGLLKGMWQKSIDANTIQVQPGSIEIGGITHNQGSTLNVTLSGNLRSGESEAANTYFYLYAIKSDTRSPTYKFSTSAPGKDRFGNTITFVDSDTDQDLYHPSDNTWRYIGQVYNDASSNILPFARCKPGYWESSWTSLPGSLTQQLKHGLARIPSSFDIQFSADTNGTNKTIWCSLYPASSYTYGMIFNQAPPTLSLMTVYFGTGGTWFNGSSWSSSGYYKLIIKQ